MDFAPHEIITNLVECQIEELMNRALGLVNSVLWIFSWIALATMGCGSGDGDSCPGDVRIVPEVFHGTSLPTFVPLEAGQIIAVGNFDGCTGTLIAPTWVLSATHCKLGLQSNLKFCMGPEPSMPATCFDAKQVVTHPVRDVDLTLVELTEDARIRLPEVVPVPIMQDVMDENWIGRKVEAAGYGQTETNTLGTRFFTAEPIAKLTSTFVTVDGQGQRGLCFGDSGGPVFAVAPDNTVRVAGALSTGDTSCTGKDNFSRTDLQQEWIESYTGPTMPATAGCGRVDGVGRCDGGMAMWCENGSLRTEACAAGSTCGWDNDESAFRCITGSDPCGGFDRRGACDGNVARWCEDGKARTRDCEFCGEICNPFATIDGAYCLLDPCMGETELGRCDGNTAVWCEDGRVLRRDCSAFGQTCGLISTSAGYFCMQ